jgi:DNA-binding CsgD family transcriptional regulator
MAYADIAERSRALSDADAAAAAAKGAAATLDRYSGVLDPGQYPLGQPVAMAVAYAQVAAAESARAEGRPDPEAWTRAVEAWDELSFVLERAYAQWRKAEAIVAGGGEREEAAGLAGVAITTAAGCGAVGLLGRITAFARAARLPVPEAAPAEAEEGVDPEVKRLGLTDRETEVLALVAGGRTNREIGETLFIAEKTASVHVSRILGKLGVRSRVEAATAAQRLGIGAGDSGP